MDYRVVWVHGIGQIQAGYSLNWTQAYNPYLNFPSTDYLEVLWSDVYRSMMMMSVAHPGANEMAQPLTAQEQVDEANVRKELLTVLLARSTAQVQSPALLGEWSQVRSKAATSQALFPPWVWNPDAYIGEFVKYLVSRSIRNAVKAKAKEQLRQLVNRQENCSIIAHSWGTVVAYESLIDLEREQPTFGLNHLFTLGSPLWLVHYLLDERSGRKPTNVANWVNIHARGDVIGAGLNPGFQVNADYAVESFGNGDPHGSYFVPGNVAVERNIVAGTILR